MSKPSRKIIVTCAVTGAIHTPTMSDALPYRPEDIARQAIDAAQAGRRASPARTQSGERLCVD